MTTLIDMLRGQAAARPSASAFTYLQDGDAASAPLTFAAIDRRARAIAACLQRAGMEGERALMLYPPGLDFVTGFFGCLYAGVIAVPAYPPKANQSFSRLQAMVGDAAPRFALTTSALIGTLTQRAGASGDLPAFEWLATDACPEEAAAAWVPPAVTGDSLALLQYTSGSTGHAKGVMVTHANLLHNLEGQRAVWECTPESVMVTWLPAFHDLGLVFGVLQPLYAGFHCYMMSPAAFLQRPFRWMQAISRHRATHTSGPNFAYDLCSAKVSDAERATLDLGSVRYAMIAAEPVREQTIRRFHERFGPHGFRAEACCPGYGLAEGTLAVTCQHPRERPVIERVDPQRLGMNQVVEAQPDGASVGIVACGAAHPGVTVTIVDPESLAVCRDGDVGEVWAGGASIARGYWRKPEETAATFEARLVTGEGPFLRTGDLGFVRHGQLFITGRLKDLIIIRGQNHYPQDIELTIEGSHSALRSSSSAAFSIPHAGEERLVVVAEVERTALRSLDVSAVVAGIRRAVSARHDLQLHAIALLKPASILKTSSGKIQRRACRTVFLAGGFEPVAEWRQDAADPALARATASVSPDDTRTWLIDRVAAICAVRREEIDPSQGFSRYGMDSLGAVTLTADLEDRLGRPMPVTLAYDYPTIDALAAFLADGPAKAGPYRDEPAADGPVKTGPYRNEVAIDQANAGVDISGRVRPFEGLRAALTNVEGRLQPDRGAHDIAIIGVACRFPQADTPEAFWRLLRNGVDAVTEWPASRRNLEVGPRTIAGDGGARTRWGGFLDRVDGFDAPFFGISAREAASIDPQQRLLLEVAWEALERAGTAPARLARSRTGVFVGISGNDYARLQLRAGEGTDAWSGTGSALSIAANRLSYLLDLRGPSVSVDTACSSSLVAVHLACQSLRLGESTLAIAAGVNLILSFEWSTIFADAQMLAPDGRCKTFDASADGYVRGEGCGVVVLKRLDMALADGDPILAVVRGSAVNQDGRSHGLTAPNGPAQADVITRALADAALRPGDISYIEAHGTGTALGDPIEAGALAAVFADGRTDPLRVGSVKTNIGHTEAAAGIAGLTKVLLAMQHRELPPNLHFRSLNSGISPAWPMAVPTAAEPWGRRNDPLFAGVSSFGFGGTNAHLVLEGPPLDEASEAAADPPLGCLLPLSAPTVPALRALASRFRDAVDGSPRDVCATAATGRNHFTARLAVEAGAIDDVKRRLDGYLAGTVTAGEWHGSRETADEPPIAFLFTGQGSQYWGMARELFARATRFREPLEEAAAALDPHLDVPLLDLLFAERGRPLIDRTGYAQPAIFAIEWALVAWWRSLGIEPGLVLGHSVGEYAAAAASGVMTLADAGRLVAARGRLMQEQAPGRMAAVLAGADEVRRALESDPHVEIAAINGPASVVIAGPAGDLERAVARLTRERFTTRPLTVSHAFHSAMMEPMLPAFASVAATVAFHAPTLSFLSSMTPEADHPDVADAAYWVSQVRRPVQFARAIERAWAKGYRTFVEIGPDATLTSLSQQAIADAAGATWVASLRRGRPDADVIREAVARVYVAGGPVDWRAWDPEPRARRLLPTYPFERQTYWVGAPAADRERPIVDVEVRWEPVDSTGEGVRRRWLAFTDAQGVAAPIVAALRVRGDTVVTVDAGTDAAKYSPLLQEPIGGAPFTGVLYFGAIDAPDPSNAVPSGWEERCVDACVGAVHLVQTIAALSLRVPVWLITRGAVAAVDADVDLRVGQAPMWGVGKVLGVEHPELWGGVIDLDPRAAEAGDAVGDALSLAGTEDHLAIRSGRIYAARLRTAAPRTAAPPPVRPDASYLITGGTGALGLAIASHLVSRGARTLVLLSRRGAESEAAQAAVEAMRAAGAHVGIARADAGSVAQLDAALDGIRRDLPPLAGIVHAAGVLDDGMVLNLDRERFARVFHAKAVSAWNLHRATSDLPLDFFVLCSSAAALVGSAGQASYVAANVFLDALSLARNRAALPALAIDWGLWDGDGLGARVDGRHLQRLAALGFRPLRPSEGLQAFDRLLGRAGQVGVVRADWPAYAAAHHGQSLVRPFVATAQPGSGPGRLPRGWYRDRLAQTPPASTVDALTRLVHEQAAAVLGGDVDKVSIRRGFFDQGMDSLLAMQLRSRLEAALDVVLPTTITFEQPTPEKLAQYLAANTSVGSGSNASARTGSNTSVGSGFSRTSPSNDDPIAIVGIGCRFPGGGSNPDAFWRFLRSGRDAVTEVPRDRWDVDRYYDANRDRAGTIYTKHGSFLESVDRFDAPFFDISRREAESLDPQQRLLLEVAWEALEEGGHAPDRLRESRTGVFVGVGQFDYARRRLMGASADLIGPYDGTGNGLSFAAGRISYCLGLQGPSVAVDTACSASLVSLHLASQSLRSGECDVALAGGVQLMLSPEVSVFLSRAAALSPDGRCRTFDASANGYGRGEGCGIVVLKRLSDALRDNDRIAAVIRASAVNHDGPSSGLTVPSASAQRRLIHDALDRAGLAPDDIDYIEAHGTGTALGDPIEISGLTSVFGGRAAEREPLRIGSVKTNVGHLEAAAGIAGLIKVVLALRHEAMPAHLHCDTPNPSIPWRTLPFRIATGVEPWRAGERVRRAGVSSFGISGTNAHVIVEEAPRERSSAQMARVPGPYLFVLSARTGTALQSLARAYAQHLAERPDDPLDGVCWTLQAGRSALPERAAMVVADRTELASRLTSVARGEAGAGIVRGRAAELPSRAEAIAIPADGEPRRRALERVAAAWVGGAAIDWASAAGGATPPTIGLPTYPWERQRYWLDVEDDRSSAPPDSLRLRRVSSPLPRPEIEFQAAISAGDPLAGEHRVFGRAVLPAAACLDMALQTARIVDSANPASLIDCRFLRPVVAGELRLVLTPTANGEFTFDLYSMPAGDESWTRCASGRIVPAGQRPPRVVDLRALGARLTGTASSSRAYADLQANGIDLGASFQVLGDIRSGDGEALSRLERGGDGRYAIDPGLVDGSSPLHMALNATHDAWLLAAVADVTLDGSLADACWAYARRDDSGTGELSFLDEHGRVLLSMAGQRFERVNGSALRPIAPAMPMYEVTWVPLPATPRAARPAADAGTWRYDAAVVASLSGADDYREADRRLERLAADFVADAFDDLANGRPMPRRFTADKLAQHFEIAPKHRPLFDRLLDILGEEGWLAADGTAWIARMPRGRRAARERARALALEYPCAALECELLARCGGSLADVLQGNRDPLPLLFPQQGPSAATLYRDSRVAQVMNGLAAAAARSLIPAAGARSPLRVLEIGAGSGATTDALLACLPPATEYWFTDISPAFVQQARVRYAGRARVSYARLDMERAPSEQGVPAGAFDLVVASNVLHATRTLANTLAHVRMLMAPGGRLVLVEGTERRRWVDLIFGLTDGWWLFADRDVRSHPLATAARWTELLTQNGFGDVVTGPEAADRLAGQTVIIASAQARSESRSWWVVCETGGAGAELVASIAERGERGEIVALDAIGERLARASEPVGLVYLAASPAEVSAGGPSIGPRAVRYAQDALGVIQAVRAAGRDCRIWFVIGDLAHAPVRGMARTLALEHPDRWGGLIDLDGPSRDLGAEFIAADLLSADRREDEVAYRANVRSVPRLKPVAPAAVESPLAGGAWLITGGLGAFGLATAEYLARRGVHEICLTGRRGPQAPDARAAVTRVGELGADATVIAADVTDEASMARALRSFRGRLAGIVHAAGTTGYSLLDEATPAAASDILRPKIEGAWTLHRLTRDIELQHFICYSSMVSVWGARGQGPYVAANAFLDALAHHRRAAGLPATTVNWGPLAGGMLPPELVGELRQMGIGTATFEDAAAMLDRVLAHGAAQTVVVDIDWHRFLALYRSRRPTAFFDLVESAKPIAAATGVVDGRSLLLNALEGERRGLLLDHLAGLMASVVNVAGTIDTTAGLFDLGLDSLGAMELRRSLERSFALALPSTVLFDYPSLDALAGFMLEQLPQAERVPPSINTMNEEELESLLLRKLEEIG